MGVHSGGISGHNGVSGVHRVGGGCLKVMKYVGILRKRKYTSSYTVMLWTWLSDISREPGGLGGVNYLLCHLRFDTGTVANRHSVFRLCRLHVNLSGICMEGVIRRCA